MNPSKVQKKPRLSTREIEQTIHDLETGSQHALERAIQLALQAKVQSDAGRWVIGDLAVKVKSHYGKATIRAFAENIGVAHKTLYEYRQIARAIAPHTRARYANTRLGWAHFRIAIRASKVIAPEAFLDTCLEKNLTVEDARKKANALLNKTVPVGESPLQRIQQLEQQVEMLQAALLPFAAAAVYDVDVRVTDDDTTLMIPDASTAYWGEPNDIFCDSALTPLTVAHLRDAARALGMLEDVLEIEQGD